MINKNIKIAIIGLGYVGLPLAIAFGKKYSVYGYDKDEKRVSNLKKKIDQNNDVSSKEFKKSKYLQFCSNEKKISTCNIYIICVPTPVKKNFNPDLSKIVNSTKMIAKYISKNDIVIYESTVYPGLTEEICVPILTKLSKLKYNIDFFCGYSPERINPADRSKKLTNIVKVTSGSTKKTAIKIDQLYSSIIKAGTFMASSIKVAEAAKVIENAQRDINIAFVNQLSIIFDKLNLKTHEVLEAASTKWNFANYHPGFVGGHCIGVDPYYLSYKAKMEGVSSDLILAGRDINNQMPKFILSKIKKILKNKNTIIKKTNVLIAGLSFKKNCADTRNSQISHIVNFFLKNANNLTLYDPLVNAKFYNKIPILNKPSQIKSNFYNILIVSVNHDIFKKQKKFFNNSLDKNNNEIFNIHNMLIGNE